MLATTRKLSSSSAHVGSSPIVLPLCAMPCTTSARTRWFRSVDQFVGRTAELALVRDAFDEARLVTLVGPGGVGKSRTALRGVGDLGERFPDGV